MFDAHHMLFVGDHWSEYRFWFYAFVTGFLLCLALLANSNRILRKEVRRRRVVKAELRDQLAFQHAMLDVIPHAICVRDAEARMISCNAAYEQLFGTTREAMAGRTAVGSGLAYASRERLGLLHKRYLKLLADRSTISEDVDVTIDGQPRKIFHWAASIGFGPGREARALVAGAIDVTERHHLVEQLELARIEAERASRAKTNFLATMSHEIRTPMNAVMGLLELLIREGRLVPHDRESADLARTSAQSLLGLIDDILDISKIEEGALVISPAPAQLRALVNEVARVFEGLAKQRGLRISVEIDPAVGSWHLVDAARLKQIANNLVSNAIKYTDVGGITLHLQHVDAEDGFETVLLEVVDTGIGIEAADVPHLFQPFFQAESAGPRAIGGTGLGLPIVQRLCLKMGGTIEVRSDPGAGTCVRTRFRFPMTRGVADPASAEMAQAAAELDNWRGDALRILAVDDHPANRLLLQRQLAHLGLESELAEDGESAFELWRDGGFDLVITDCSMPRMDGYALARAIRDTEHRRQLPRCPVLGCTAHVQEEDRIRAVEAGMDECLTKPFSLKDLSATLQRYLGAGTSAGPTPPASEASVSTPRIDLLAMRGFSGGDVRIEANFASVLLQSNLSDIAEIAAQVRAGSWADAAAGAHKIRGAARTVAALDVIESCEALERACALPDPGAVGASLAALTSALDEFNEVLSELRDRVPA